MPAVTEQLTLVSTNDGPAILELLQRLRGLRYGSIEIIVHDGHIVQIERREKLRVDPSAPRVRAR